MLAPLKLLSTNKLLQSVVPIPIFSCVLMLLIDGRCNPQIDLINYFWHLSPDYCLSLLKDKAGIMRAKNLEAG